MNKEMNFNAEMTSEYDRGIRRTFPTYDQLFRIVHAYLNAQLNEESRLLIDGAGGGTELTVFAPNNPGWHFAAVDPSESMLQLAQGKMEQLNLTQQVDFFSGIVQNLEASSFDAATSLLVLHFIEDDEQKLAHLKAIRARLTDGAPFVIAALYGDRESAEFKTIYALWKACWLHTTKLTADQVDKMGETLLSQSILTEDEIRHLLTAAGFRQITNFFKTNLFGAWVCQAQ